MKVWKVHAHDSYAVALVIIAAKSAKQAEKVLKTWEFYPSCAWDFTIEELYGVTADTDIPHIICHENYIE